MLKDMLRILFLCTGNAGRSQMAAAFARQLAGRHTEILCAGDRPQEVHPAALEVMREAGLEIEARVTLTPAEIQATPFDVVVTLCNQARELCPVFPGAPARIHWPLPDPVKRHSADGASGNEAFRAVRDEIRRRVDGLLRYGFLESIDEVRRTLGSLLDNLTDGVLAHDVDRRIFFFNQAAQRITGYGYGEVMGQDCHEIFPHRFCGGECAFCEDRPCLAESRLRYSRTFARKDGELRDLEMSTVPIRTPAGEVTGALVIFRDVSEVLHLRRRLEQSRGFCGIVGRHASMLKVFDSIRELADVNVPILIQGESGTGKEMVATALHQLSSRASGPFVPVNCSALPEGTLESELFGHVRGAFTGAVHDRKGRFAIAEGGTLFLDEVGDISPAMQVKLLRVIQEKSFVPVGGEKSVRADVRIICATHRDLRLLTQQGLFREDLYYRLAVVPIYIPPLRERRSDIPILVEYFLDRFSSDTGRRVKDADPQALELLTRYNWPGNVRELANAVQYAMIKCREGSIRVAHLPPEIRGIAGEGRPGKPGPLPKLNTAAVLDALRKSGGNRAKAARLLGVSRTTLYRFIRAHPALHDTHM